MFELEEDEGNISFDEAVAVAAEIAMEGGFWFQEQHQKLRIGFRF